MPIVGVASSSKNRRCYYVNWNKESKIVSIYSCKKRSWLGCVENVNKEKDALLLAQRYIDAQPPHLLP